MSLANNQAWQTISQFAILVGLLLAALGGYGVYHFGKRIEREKEASAAYTGEIKPKNQVVLSGKDHIWPQLEFDNSGAIFVYTGPQGAPLFEFMEDANLTVIREDGRVKVSLRIFNKTGQLVAELAKNEWRVNPVNSFDRNYSSDALEGAIWLAT